LRLVQRGEPFRPFKARNQNASLLQPSPEFIPGVGSTVATVALHRGQPTVSMTVYRDELGHVVRLTPELARCLAWQLMDAADQIDSGDAK
jgi:hypothetical protein